MRETTLANSHSSTLLVRFNKIFSCWLQLNAALVSHFLGAETCEFSQVPSLSNILVQTSLDDQSTICQTCINLARYTQWILQMLKSRIGPFCPPNPRKSIVYTCHTFTPCVCVVYFTSPGIDTRLQQIEGTNVF